MNDFQVILEINKSMDGEGVPNEPNLIKSTGMDALDELFFNAMSLLQELLQVRSKLAQTLRLGYHLLAKARYIMGNKRVGTAQLPGPGDEVLASRTVRSQLPPYSDCYYLTLHNVSKELSIPSSAGRDGIFRRTVDAVEKENDCEIETMKSPTQLSPVNPLRWFGVLVPQELKMAQSAFQCATELCISVANLQLKVENVSQQFWSLIECNSEILHEDEP